MRVRIVCPMKGSIDGIDLSKFRIDFVYDMSTTLANYLMASGYAVPVIDDQPALVVPLQELDTVVDLSPRDTASDRPPRSSRRKPR
jgi:hypothetical protein